MEYYLWASCWIRVFSKVVLLRVEPVGRCKEQATRAVLRCCRAFLRDVKTKKARVPLVTWNAGLWVQTSGRWLYLYAQRVKCVAEAPGDCGLYSFFNIG